MTELELYKWIRDWEPEYRWDINSETKRDDVIVWVSVHTIESFVKMLPATLLDEGGIDARLVDKSIAIWASEICEPLDIKMENVFPRE